MSHKEQHSASARAVSHLCTGLGDFYKQDPDYSKHGIKAWPVSLDQRSKQLGVHRSAKVTESGDRTAGDKICLPRSSRGPYSMRVCGAGQRQTGAADHGVMTAVQERPCLPHGFGISTRTFSHYCEYSRVLDVNSKKCTWTEI